jgi:hypothetical protein
MALMPDSIQEGFQTQEGQQISHSTLVSKAYRSTGNQWRENDLLT